MKTLCRTRYACAFIKTRVRCLNNVARHLKSQETSFTYMRYIEIQDIFIYIHIHNLKHKHIMRIRDTQGSQPRAKPGLTEFIWKM